jgi:hypothetical protein
LRFISLPVNTVGSEGRAAPDWSASAAPTPAGPAPVIIEKETRVDGALLPQPPSEDRPGVDIVADDPLEDETVSPSYSAITPTRLPVMTSRAI